MRAGFGDRFRYLTGVSGRRYLFTAITTDELADFRSAVVVLARREPMGLRALAVAELDAGGHPVEGAASWGDNARCNRVVLVHLLAEQAMERRAAVRDLERALLPGNR